MLWARLNREVVAELEAELDRELVFFMRAGFTQSPRHSTLFWAGDQATVWDDRDGLQSAIIALINGGFSGIALNYSDVGGYTSLAVPVSDQVAALVPEPFRLSDPATGQKYAAVYRSPELLLRWAEANAFTTLLRTHKGLAPQINAQVWSTPELAAAFARIAAVFKAFAPYRAQLMQDAAEKGWPLVRHPVMHSDDGYFSPMTPETIQFMLGADVMVAPVVQPGDDSRIAHLPQGEWTHLWSGQTYTVGAQGKTFTEADGALGFPPVYVDMSDPLVAGAVDALKAAGVVSW